MEKSGVVAFWKNFFSDLLTGAFKSLFIYCAGGMALGMTAVYVLYRFFMEPAGWNAFLQWPAVFLAAVWYGSWGLIHGLAASAVSTIERKLSEMIGGLHGLLDILSREVLGRFPKLDNRIPREDLERKFDEIGKSYLDDLRLKKGPMGLLHRTVFAVILKGLKFSFLDEVVEKLKGKTSGAITSADIESALRRTGAGMVLSPILDNFLLLKIFNYALMIATFGIPFGILWAF
ncbi:MAG: hypothetical protein HY580_08000 [Nitrospinae bacterium]|nr:hypothetical protein [Nitrospinota bacterium]